MMPKFRYKIKVIAGEYYYEKMSMEEAIDKIFVKADSDDKLLKNQSDIDAYMRDNLNIKLPLDGPLARIYVQKYDADDQKHLPANQKSKSILIWKCHHSFCDGVSVSSLFLAASEDYDRSFFV